MVPAKIVKAFNLRIPKEQWSFLRRESVDKETTMTAIIVSLIRKHIKKSEKKLTENNT